MTAWSSLLYRASRKLLPYSLLIPKNVPNKVQIKRMSDHHVFQIMPTNWEWQKTKDYVHFYVMLGVIPIFTFIAYMNIFVGPSTLEPIPKGYVPKHWEYYQYPIERMFARILPPYQEHYEKYLDHLYTIQQKVKLKKLLHDVREMKNHDFDWQGSSARDIYLHNYEKNREEYKQRHPSMDYP